MFIYTKARTIFVVQNLEFQYISDFLKNEYFLGYEDFVDICFGSSQNMTGLVVISIHLRVFS